MFFYYPKKERTGDLSPVGRSWVFSLSTAVLLQINSVLDNLAKTRGSMRRNSIWVRVQTSSLSTTSMHWTWTYVSHYLSCWSGVVLCDTTFALNGVLAATFQGRGKACCVVQRDCGSWEDLVRRQEFSRGRSEPHEGNRVWHGVGCWNLMNWVVWRGFPLATAMWWESVENVRELWADWLSFSGCTLGDKG